MIQALITDRQICPGEMIRQLRDEKNLSISQLAKLSGISSGAISRWENNKRTPTIESFAAILNALDAQLVAIRRVR